MLGLLVLASCQTTLPPTSSAPAYTQAASHYRAFSDAATLAAYLRHDSDAGLLVSAHRGGPIPAYPENALATFDRALQHAPVLLECDVRVTRDGQLVLLHDETLDRTTTGSGPLAEHDFADLRALLLRDETGTITPFRIPTLAETLAWAEGRAVLTLDVKREVAPEALVAAVRQHAAENRVVVIVYDLDALLTYQRLAPDLNYSVSVDTVADLEAILEAGVSPDRLIAFTGVGTVRPEVIAAVQAQRMRAMLGTFGEIDRRAQAAGAAVYHPLLAEGLDVLATDAVALAAEAIASWRAIHP